MSNIERTVDLGHDESVLLIIHKHAAHRLVQHTLQVVEVAWTDGSTLAIFFYMRYRYCLHRAVVRKGWSPVIQHRHRESGNKEKHNNQNHYSTSGVICDW